MEDLTKEQYTKEEVQQILKEQEEEILKLTEEFDNAITEHKKLKAKYDNSIKQLEDFEDLKKENLSNNIKLEMLKNGVSEEFYDLVQSEDVEQAQEKINKLVELQKQNKIENSYKPETYKNDDEYEQAEKKGDTQGMLKNKFGKFFQAE